MQAVLELLEGPLHQFLGAQMVVALRSAAQRRSAHQIGLVQRLARLDDVGGQLHVAEQRVGRCAAQSLLGLLVRELRLLLGLRLARLLLVLEALGRPRALKKVATE